eukprot:GHVU01207730.1.p1 GENE.GHVU01207730.1~~GHVU01207730.1.p1  ORF type:complete len:119 (-),score=11.63 GHVU01207730.1:533-889(-)
MDIYFNRNCTTIRSIDEHNKQLSLSLSLSLAQTGALNHSGHQATTNGLAWLPGPAPSRASVEGDAARLVRGRTHAVPRRSTHSRRPLAGTYIQHNEDGQTDERMSPTLVVVFSQERED